MRGLRLLFFMGENVENPNWMQCLNMFDVNICKRVTYKCLSKNLDRVKKT